MSDAGVRPMLPDKLSVHLTTPKANGPGLLASLEQWSKIAAAVAIPVVLAIYGSKVSTAAEKEKARLKYVELAIGVLSAKDQDPELRDYAVQLLDLYSEVKFSPSLATRLREGKVMLPGTEVVGGITRDEARRGIDTAKGMTADAAQWGKENCPAGTTVEADQGFTSAPQYPGERYTFWTCVATNGQQEGPVRGVWLSSRKTFLEGYNRSGRNAGWWNYYGPKGDYRHSNCYSGGEAVVKEDTKGPHKVGSPCE